MAEHCHLATDAATRHDLQATDFEVLDFRDTTEMTHCEARAAEKLEAEGLSPFGLGLLFGGRTYHLQLNTLIALEEAASGRSRWSYVKAY